MEPDMTKPDIDISPEAIVRAAYDLRAHGVYRTDMDIADMLEALAADRDRLAAVTRDMISAWESLPGGRNYLTHEIEAWLCGPMKAAVDRARMEIAS